MLFKTLKYTPYLMTFQFTKPDNEFDNPDKCEIKPCLLYCLFVIRVIKEKGEFIKFLNGSFYVMCDFFNYRSQERSQGT